MAKRHTEDFLTAKLRDNPWILATLVLVVFSLVLIVALLQGNLSDESIGPEEAMSIVTNIVQLQTGEAVDVVEVNFVGNEFYEVVVLYQNQTIPVYLTKDGKNLVDGIIPVELFIQQIQEYQEQQQILQKQIEMQIQNNSVNDSFEDNVSTY